MDNYFKNSDAKYKVYTKVIFCDDNELLVDQYIGNHEGEERHITALISDNEYIDLYKQEGAEAVLINLNKAEFIKLSKYIERQEKTINIYKDKGKTTEAKSIFHSLSVSGIWIQRLTDWFVDNGFDVPINKVKKLPKYKEYENLFDKFYNDKNADPMEVKSVLNDKSRWSNPSSYLADSRRNHNVTVAELKKHRGFGWIDPKSTAID